MLRPAIAFLALAGLLSACSDTPTAPGSPGSAHAYVTTMTAGIQPGTVIVTPSSSFSCPLLPPFTTSFSLFLQSLVAVPMTVDEVTFHFLDGSNVSSHPITFPNGRLVPAGASVTLPFSLRFGCDIGRPLFVFAEVKLVDPQGASHTVSVQAGAH
jgi:hypothetical protein